ncbi:hypothetical protein INS49_000262 [Diaporthe citri]|uniref:uncharacterized protein n=1 Tax=Diaporthe citri TaxID=83186 RepID=UPI001C7FA9DE|nr:uncharacterized protein INS49_000262 [Diaporthe citri]KAG6366086.1 hypothetical protein INS49_000262 [Diaporthe citri]
MATPNAPNQPDKRRIFLNAFDMFTVGHMSYGQWHNPKDKSATKRRDLSYWTDLARLLEGGDFNALFLADTYGWFDVFRGHAEACVRTGTQSPMGDPAVPVAAMAAVTRNLGFAITSSTSFDAPYVLAKRFSTLDHLFDRGKDIYANYQKIRTIHHKGEHFTIEAPHILDPSPQRTPFIFQAGTSPAGIQFGATHAEGIFVVGLTPDIVAPRVRAIRAKAAEVGRDPRSIKIFASITPVLGRTPEEAEYKYQEALQHSSEEGALAYWCGNSGIDLSRFDPDDVITEQTPGEGGSVADVRIQSLVANLSYKGEGVPE